MVLTYIRMRCSREAAMARYGDWVGAAEVEAPRLVRERDSIDLACNGDEWKGLVVFVYESGPWTVFQNYSGGLADRPIEKWLELARGDELVYVDCNDAALYGEIIVIKDGRLVRHFLQDEEDPGKAVNVGTLPEESGLFARRFKEWVDVIGWAEADADRFALPDKGWLWIHQASWPSA